MAGKLEDGKSVTRTRCTPYSFRMTFSKPFRMTSFQIDLLPDGRQSVFSVHIACPVYVCGAPSISSPFVPSLQAALWASISHIT